MRVLTRKLYRDLLLAKGMLLAILAIVVVGTACFVGMLQTYNNLERARLSYYSRCRMADFWLHLKKAPVYQVRRLLEMPGVSEIHTRISFPVIVDLPDVLRPLSGQVYSLPEKPRAVLNGIVLRRGSYFSQHKRNEVIVSEKFAAARGIELGSSLDLILNGQRRKLFVVGTAISSEYMYLTPPGSIAPAPSEYAVFYIKQDYAQEVFGFQGACNEVVGYFTPQARRNSEAVFQRMEQDLSSYGVMDSFPRARQFSHLAITSEIMGLRIMSFMLPMIFLGVAALVLNVLMTRMAEQQRTVIGTLKALGYHNAEITSYFLKYGLVVGIVGGVGGCVMGHSVSGAMLALYDTLFEFPRLQNRIYPGIMMVAVWIAILFSLAGCLRGLKRVASLNPADAMRPKMPALQGRIFLEKWPGLWQRLSFRWQMALRGVLRNKIRTAIGILAATMGAALVLLGFGMKTSFENVLDLQFNKVRRGDFQLTLKSKSDRGAWEQAKRLPGVTAVEPMLHIAGTFYHKNFRKKGNITGLLPQAQMTVPHNHQGEAVALPETGLLMPQRLAEQLGIQVGEKIYFKPAEGRRETYSLPVTRLTQSIFGLNVYSNYHYLNRVLSEEHALSQLQLQVQQTSSQQAEFYEELKNMGQLQSVANLRREKKRLRHEFIAKFANVIYVLILFASVIFFGSILNGSLILILERHREIATLRVLGYHPWQIGQIFLWENLIVNLTGAILGLPVGYGMLLQIMQEFHNDSYAIPLSVSSGAFVGTLILALFFVVAAHFVVQKNINQLVWQDALKMKE